MYLIVHKGELYLTEVKNTFTHPSYNGPLWPHNAQASVILNNILGYSATAGMHYNDEIPAWAQTSIDALRELGIYPVSGGAANPAAMLTKEDTAKMLFNLMTLLDE